MKKVKLPSGDLVLALGQGTWHMDGNAATRSQEIAALRRGLDLGLTLIDTAEMYGEGLAEELISEAISGRRDEVFLVSKVYPQNASRRGAVLACDRSLRRLRTDRIDLYLLHWRGNVPLDETLEAFLDLQRLGKIRHFGVSNLDLGDMEELWPMRGGKKVATNQLLYNLTRRGIEFDLLPWLRERNVPIMAYSPLEEGRLIRNKDLIDFARKHERTPAQVALAWLVSHDDVIAIPKSSKVARVEENVNAVTQPLTPEELQELERLFPAPRTARPLETI